MSLYPLLSILHFAWLKLWGPPPLAVCPCGNFSDCNFPLEGIIEPCIDVWLDVWGGGVKV